MEQRKIPDHIETPSSIRLGVSQVDKRRLGSFSTCSIPKGTEFGPYKGKIVYDKLDETVDPKFSWKVFDLATFKYLHTVDATCPADGNWMRYVCCARYFEEQNIVSTQNGTDVYYRALKDIESGEELLTWFEQKKKKRKKSSVRNSNDSDEMPRVSSSSSLQTYSDTPPQSPGKTKRKRKPKIIPDAYEGPIDWEDQEQKAKKPIVKEDEFEPLQPGQKRRRRKKPSIDSVGNVDSNLDQKPIKSSAEIDDKKSSITNETDGVFDEIGEKEGDVDGNIEDSDSKNASFNSETSLANSVEGKKETSHLSIAEINNSVEWEFPKAGEEYNFELKKHHVVKDNGKKIYRCDICLGLYKHMFSLKRHYLRNHINYKYISKADMTNCLINLMQAKQQMKTKLAALADLRTFKVKPDANNLKTHLSETQIDNQTVNSLPAVADGDVVNINQANVNGMKPEIDLKNETSDKDSKKSEDMHSKSEHVVNDINNGKSDDANIDKDNRSSQDEILDNKLKPEIVEPAISHQSEDNTNDNLLSDNKLKQDSDDKPDSVENGSEKNSQDVTDKNNVMTSMPGLFRCYTCYLTFDDFEGIREHTQNHPEQMEGECFPCDLCSMRFNYKHNLIRHKKTHFSEDSIKATTSSSSSAATSVTSTSTSQGQDKPSPKKHLLPSKVKPSPEKKPGLLPSVFRCGVCPMKFDTQQLVVKHVEEEHKNGSKFQCIYCGKDFLSMPNMKKHVRFHLGYRATCKICSEAFSNVGALRKHTRVVHPEDYRAKLIERLQKYGVLKGPDKNALSKEVIDKISSDHKASKVAEQPKEAVEPVKKEKVKSESNSPVPEKEEEIDHEINFTADEIDDGGSRFKFACTVCKKRFSSYINMCRHRRKVHSNENRHRTIECLTFGRKPRVNPSPILENPLDVAAFFANISHNIATNLNCFIDGKSESLKSFASHIKVEDYNGSFGYSADSEADVKLSLNQYNFPQGFKLVETISFADIKNNLNIHNDFDSHCTSAAADFPENNVCVQEQTESAEDSEVRQINSIKDFDDKFNTMKTTSQGFKVFANVGSLLSKKGSAPFLHGDKEMGTVDGPQVKVSGGQTYHNANLPAAHTFHQIERGEYANFQDDLTGDMDNPIAVRSQSVSSSRSWSSKRSYRQKEAESTEDEDRLSPTSLTKTLVKDAQGEIEALYDDIDNMKPVQNVNNNNKTPKSLSSLCEKVLGLRSASKDKKASSLTNEVATHLKLSTKEDRMNGPDFSDVPEDSPFYNYDTIMFGRNGQIEQICAICRRRYSDVDHLLRHHMKKHPASVCSFLEVENGNDIEDLHFSQPCPIGALAVTDPGLESVSELPDFRCTNCDSTFPSMSKLHVHIVNCSSIDPLYGVKKSEKSPMKTTFRKKFQKKIFNMFGSSKNYRSNFAGSRFNHHSSSSLNHKRVFMGCRKRKAVILPDSPVKTVMDQKQLLQSGSGYNPQNHARRREFTDVLNNLMCEACGLQFKTIILLERHVKHCDKKEKFKTLQPMTSSLDNYFDKKKNMCLYCNKNFTYTKSLLNHFQDFCPVKKTKLDNGELTELEKQKEAEIIERIHKADEEKALKQKEMEARPKRKISWQVGRKSKRKGHSWTNIKKRNQLKGSKGSSEGSEEINGEVDDADADDDDNDDDIDETSSDSDDDNDDGSDNNGSSPDNNNSPDHNDNDEDVFQADSQEVTNVSEEINNSNNGLDETGKCSNKDEKEHDSISAMEIVNDEREEVKASNESHEDLTEKFKYENSESESKVDPNVEKNVCELKQTVDEENEGGETFKVTDDFANCEEITDRLLSENEQTLKRYSIGNTSLNCTARYKVNDVQLPKKYRPIRPKPTLFRCVSGQLTNSGEPGNAVFEPKPSTANTDHSYQNKMSKVKHQNRMSDDKQIVTQSDNALMVNTDASEITGKRRRKQVGKVEEFLKAFRKKNKKKSENTISAENCEQATENSNNVKCDSLYKNETCQREVNMTYEMKLDAHKTESQELDMPNISSKEMNNSGFVSFDLPPGSTPPIVPRKRGRPRKEQKGNSPNKKLGRPPKLFPSVKSSVPNLLKRRVGRPPKLKRENIEMINRTEMDAVIPDVMTNPALTFTHLVKNSEMKYIKDNDVFEKMPEKLDRYPSAGFKDGNNVANNVADVPVDNVVNTNDLGKFNDDDHDIDEVDNYSDPATEPFSDSGDDIDELYQEALNKEQIKANDEEESLKDDDHVEYSGSVQKMALKETINAETDDSVRTEIEDINEIVNREKFNEIDGGQRTNETSNVITSDTAVTADYKDEIQEVDNITQSDTIDEIVNTESETNPESDYKTESECENVTEEEVDDRVENVEVSDSQESMKDDCKEDGSGIKDSEKDGDSSQEDKNENFDEFLKFEPFLSPSERVKMNKRSCKKDVELTSPVWMKRTKKYIGKGEKKSEYSSKSCDSSSDVEEAVKPNAESSVDKSKDRFNDKTDDFINQPHGVKESQPSKGKKRKMVDTHEKDSKDNTVSKIPRREVKVCSKKNVSAKGKK